MEESAQLRKQAYVDSLTGLLNRHAFVDSAALALSLAKRHQFQVALFYIDLDGFKVINDSIGHSGGDAILKIVAGRLKGIVRKEDLLSRFGGDEFVLLSVGVTSEFDSSEIAKKIINQLNLPLSLRGKHYRLAASIGVALLSHENEFIDELLRNADEALYEAKSSGRNCFQVYTSRA